MMCHAKETSLGKTPGHAYKTNIMCSGMIVCGHHNNNNPQDIEHKTQVQQRLNNRVLT